jgi:hypothetical protein
MPEGSKVNSTELHDFVFFSKRYSADQTKNETSGASGKFGNQINADGVLVGKPEGKRSLGTSKSSWEDNIKMRPVLGNVRLHNLEQRHTQGVHCFTILLLTFFNILTSYYYEL